MEPRLPLPKYHRIYLVLREQLQEGRYDQDGLPGEYALAGHFGVARVTIRRALGMLAADGLVSRRPGRGTRPAGEAGGPPRPPLPGLLQDIVAMGRHTSVQVLESATVAAPQAVAQALEIAPGSPVHKSVRVRSIEAGPLSCITAYVPGSVMAVTRQDLEREPMLVLLEAAGVALGGATQTLSACLADARTAARLDVAVGSALLAVFRVVRDVRGRPVQWLHGLYRPDRYQYRMQLSQAGGMQASVWTSEQGHGHDVP